MTPTPHYTIKQPPWRKTRWGGQDFYKVALFHLDGQAVGALGGQGFRQPGGEHAEILRERHVSIAQQAHVARRLHNAVERRRAAAPVPQATLDAMVEFTRRFAEKTGAVIAITGAIDLVSDAKTTYVIRNGRAEMSKITGTGCQLSGVATAYAVANPQSKTVAVAAAVCLMGLAGEIGFAHLQPGEGNSSYRNRIIDAIYNMDAAALEKGARYEVR